MHKVNKTQNPKNWCHDYFRRIWWLNLVFIETICHNDAPILDHLGISDTETETLKEINK